VREPFLCHHDIVRRSLLIGILALAAGLALVPLARGWAQQGQVEITAPPPERERPPEFVSPGQPPQITHPREADFRSDNIRTRHDPAFIRPFTTTVRAGSNRAVRIGLSGWTAPPGRGDVQMPRNAGWFALGLTIVWDVPVEPARPQASPARPAATP